MSHFKQLSRLVLFVVGLTVFVSLVAFAFQNTQWAALHNWLSQQPPPGYYRVVSIADGDTVVVDMNGVNERVRLIGIDTPEKNHPEKPVQCFAHAASDFTSKLVKGQSVRLVADPGNDNRDQYERLLRYVYLEDGTFVNRAIVEQGYGFAYVGFPFEFRDEFLELEAQARANGTGLWSGCEVDLGGRQPETRFTAPQE